MLARVKKECRWNAIMAFGGYEYVKSEYRPVPETAHAEAKRHPYIETKTKPEKAVAKPTEKKAEVKADKAPVEKAKEPKPSGVSQAANKLAKEYGVDLKEVKGTGAAGMVTKSDVEKYIKED